jgi:predicted phage terminase large subunit-like protein
LGEGLFQGFSLNVTEILDRIGQLPLDEQKDILKLLQDYEEAQSRDAAKSKFLPFVRRMWPAFIQSRHHEIMAEAFERVLDGRCKRLIINMPPRHTKSEFASYLLPAWFIGKNPGKKIIQATHTAELAVDFGRKVRNLVDSQDYKEVFSNLKLQSDSKAAGRWNTSEGGVYFAVGVGGAIAGKGADLFIIDDPHTEQQAVTAIGDPSIYDKVFDWYTSGPRQRLQPDAAIVIVMTRWAKRDLTGRLIQTSMDRDGSSEWEVIELPAILPSGNPLWPSYWSKEALESLKSELPTAKWNAQYQQQPTNEEGAILKREWWRRWEKSSPPDYEYVIVSADTAFTKNNRSDYTAFTVWGVFDGENESGGTSSNIILLDAFKERMEFPDLKARAKEVYIEWQPDTFLIEGKASGLPLIHELRQMDIPVSEFTPTRASGDKIMRANSITDIFSSGMVWCPETKWADEVIEECASFPNGSHDDFVDSVVMALMRYRQGGFIRLPSDYEEDYAPMQRRADYY